MRERGRTRPRAGPTFCIWHVLLLLLLRPSEPRPAYIDLSTISLKFASEGVAAGVRESLRRHLAPHLVPDDSKPSMTLVIGKAPACEELIPAAELEELDADSRDDARRSARKGESFVIRLSGDERTLCAVGADEAGTSYAAFSALESLGFAFLHPLAVTSPIRLRLSFGDAKRRRPRSILPWRKAGDPTTLEATSPTLAFRSWHIHCQHPLELCEMLQGTDAVDPDMDVDRKDKTEHAVLASWESMLPEWTSFLEWAVANRISHVQWILLRTPNWDSIGFTEGETRQGRLKILADMAHSFSLRVGYVVPLANRQQHGWYIVSQGATQFSQIKKSQVTKIRQRVEWLRAAGADYLGSESGTSELTHPSCGLMKQWMDVFADHAASLGMATYMKVHCSSGQVCPEYEDTMAPKPGSGNVDPSNDSAIDGGAAVSKQGLNFNFLPQYASLEMGVAPHTVHAYALDDPVAGVYGNHGDFSFMLDWTLHILNTTERSVAFYGETNYWVNSDVNVPLHLPVFGQRRLHDLRLLLHEAHIRGVPRSRARKMGHMVFDSGWEYGSWVQDVVTARAASANHFVDFPPRKYLSCSDHVTPYKAWDPRLDITNEWSAHTAILIPPLRAAFGPELGPELASALTRLAKAQLDTMIWGGSHEDLTTSDDVDSAQDESDILKAVPSSMGPADAATHDDLAGGLSGYAYMSGWDCWATLIKVLGGGSIQPYRIDFWDVDNPLYPRVLPLLERMVEAFRRHTGEVASLLRRTQAEAHENSKNKGILRPPSAGASLRLEELVDASRILSLRAQYMHTLYATAATHAARKGSSDNIDSAVDAGADTSASLEEALLAISNYTVSGTSISDDADVSVLQVEADGSITPMTKDASINAESLASTKPPKRTAWWKTPAKWAQRAAEFVALNRKVRKQANMNDLLTGDRTGIELVGGSTETLEDGLAKARELLALTSEVVERHIQRCPLKDCRRRIYGWHRGGPTAYAYAYLWPAKTLYYWWRDYALVELGRTKGKANCFLNLHNEADMGLGFGWLATLSARLSSVLHKGRYTKVLADCLAPPHQEYTFPEDLYS